MMQWPSLVLSEHHGQERSLQFFFFFFSWSSGWELETFHVIYLVKIHLSTAQRSIGVCDTILPPDIR